MIPQQSCLIRVWSKHIFTSSCGFSCFAFHMTRSLTSGKMLPEICIFLHLNAQGEDTVIYSKVRDLSREITSYEQNKTSRRMEFSIVFFLLKTWERLLQCRLFNTDLPLLSDTDGEYETSQYCSEVNRPEVTYVFILIGVINPATRPWIYNLRATTKNQIKQRQHKLDTCR